VKEKHWAEFADQCMDEGTTVLISLPHSSSHYETVLKVLMVSVYVILEQTGVMEQYSLARVVSSNCGCRAVFRPRKIFRSNFGLQAYRSFTTTSITRMDEKGLSGGNWRGKQV